MAWYTAMSNSFTLPPATPGKSSCQAFSGNCIMTMEKEPRIKNGMVSKSPWRTENI